MSGTGKATDFKFRTQIQGVNRNKNPWSPENSHGTYIWGALRGHLFDSTAFLLTYTSFIITY